MASEEDYYCDRLIDKKELKKYVPYSSSHIARLEKSGAFPRRIHIGPCRVAWSQIEVSNWINSKKVTTSKTRRVSS